MSKFTFLALFAIVASLAGAQDRKVFGLELGKSLNAPECKLLDAHLNFYKAAQTETCFKRKPEMIGEGLEQKTGSLTTEIVEIGFAPEDTSSFMQRLTIFAAVVNGRIERIELDTYGVQDVDLVMAELQKKYGVATTSRPHQVKTLAGATFDSISANWTFPDLFVSFEGVGNSVDSGIVMIETAKGRELRLSANAAKASEGKSL